MTPTNPIPEGMEGALLKIEEILQATPERSDFVDDLAQQQDQALLDIHEISQKALAELRNQPTPHVGDSAAERAREVLANIMKRDGLDHQAEEVRSGAWDHTGYIEAMLAFASQEASQEAAQVGPDPVKAEGATTRKSRSVRDIFDAGILADAAEAVSKMPPEVARRSLGAAQVGDVGPSPTNSGNIVYRGEEWVPLAAYQEAMAGWKAANEAHDREHLAVAKGGGLAPDDEANWLRGDWYERWQDATENADDELMSTLESLRGRVEQTIKAALAEHPATPTRRGRLTMPADTSAPAEVVQADRDAAAELLGYYDEPTSLLYAIKLGLRDGHPVVQAFGTHRPAQALEGGRFWLIVREPGMVPDRKGPWPLSETAKILREFMAANPTAFIDYLTITPEGEPDIEHGPLVLQYTDGRSMSVGRKHNARTKEAAQAALAERPTMPMPDREAIAASIRRQLRDEHDDRVILYPAQWQAVLALLSQDRGEGVQS